MSEEVQTEAAPVIESAPVVESTAELQQEAPNEAQQPEAKPERTFTQEELDKIVQKRLAKESRRIAKQAEVEAENRWLKQQIESSQKPQQQPQAEPKPEDYQDYESYLRALVRHENEQAKAQWKNEAASQRQQTTQQQQASEFVQRVEAKLSEGVEKYDDFDEVVRDPTAPISQTAYAIATESEVGADLLYYLATHRDEAQKIFNMPIAAQARAIVKLEDKVTAPPKTTAAPPPITPSGQKATVQKDPSKMTDKEFADWRRKQIAQRR